MDERTSGIILRFARSRKSELHTLREVMLRETHSALRENLGWLQQASYFTTLVEQTTETETPLPQVFQLVREALRQLTTAAPTPRTVFAFELKLLEELGQSPDLEGSNLNAGAKHIVQTLTHSEWTILNRLKLAPAVKQV